VSRNAQVARRSVSHPIGMGTPIGAVHTLRAVRIRVEVEECVRQGALRGLRGAFDGCTQRAGLRTGTRQNDTCHSHARGTGNDGRRGADHHSPCTHMPPTEASPSRYSAMGRVALPTPDVKDPPVFS
jgi:hypothetical protein